MNTVGCKISGGGALRHLSSMLLCVFVFAALFIAQPAWAALVNASKSTAVASPTSVVADGVASSTITVCAKKKNGGNAGSNITVTLTAGSGSSIITGSPATTPASGCVSFTVHDTVVQSVTYTAVVGGVTITTKPTVKFALKAPTVAKSFSPTTIAANGTSTLTITLTNPNAASITGAAFTDTFPASLVTSGAASTTCAGGTATAGGTNVTLSGATIPASGSCTVTVLVTSATASAGYVNNIAIGAVTSANALANTAAASATLVVTAVSASLSTVVASPTIVLADGVSISTITVTLKDGASNPVSGKTVTLTGAPVGSVITLVSNVGGVATYTVTDATIQAVTYTAKDTSDLPNIVVTQTATVTFVSAAILKSFSTSPIAANGTSTLTVQLTNPALVAVSGFGFTDNYPAGLVNAGNAIELVPAKCGAGALTGTTGGNTLGLASTTIPASSTCTVSVLVKSATAGTYNNTATNTALVPSTASLVVTAISAINSTVSANPASPLTVLADGTSISTITVTLKDGAGTPVPGKTVSLSTGTGSSVITAVSNSGGVATFTVTDTIAEGPITYTATDTTDSITVTQTAAVTFAPITAPTVTKSFNPSTIADNGTSTLTITLTNPNAAAINGVAFTDNYTLDTGGAGGTTNNTSPLVSSNTCGGANPTTGANGAKLDLSGGTIPAQVLGVPGSCSVSVQITAANASTPFLNSTGAVTSTNANSGLAASATLTDIGVDPVKSTVVAVPTSVPADNITTSTITVTLLDGGGNPVSDDVVTLTPSGGNFSTITATCTGACTTAGTTDVNGQATFTVRDGVVQSVTYTATTIDPILITITQQATVTFGTALGGINPFNAFDKGTLPAATATTGYIMTKISGAAFTLDVVALTSAPAVFTGFTGTVKVELVDGNNGASCATYANIQTLATNPIFVAGDNGRHNIAAITEPNAWKNVYVRISYPVVSPTSVSCSNDDFAIRPASITITAYDATWVTAGTGRALANIVASGGIVHKAATSATPLPFTLRATPVPATATNYDGNPTIVAAFPTCGGLCANAVGVLSFTSGSWTAAGSGVRENATANYSEAGTFNLQLEDTTYVSENALDGSTAAMRTVPATASVQIGRFVPDHFVVTTNNTPKLKTFNNACATRSFTYLGQPFGYITAPQVLVTAQNAANATTNNYTSTLWKLTTAAGAQDCTTNPDICTLTNGSVTQTYTYTTSTSATPNWDSAQVALATPAIAAGTGGTGTVTSASTDLLAFKRSLTTPLALFTASITLTDSVKDSSEAGNCGVASCDITTLTPAAFNPVAFDAGNEFRYGRLKLSNAHGSELLKLPIPIQTQYWNGTSFATNTADNCTTLVTNNIKLTTPPAGVSATVGGAFSSGAGSLILSPPTTAAKVAVDLCVDLGTDPVGGTVCTATTSASLPYLQGLWTPGTSYNNDPGARATFGVYKGAKEFIYLRENY
jgi:MSHA biogenesis protein MshQ